MLTLMCSIGVTQELFCEETGSYIDDGFDDGFGDDEGDDNFFGIDDTEGSNTGNDMQFDKNALKLKGFLMQDAQYSYNLSSPYLSMFKTTINVSLEKSFGDVVKIKGSGNYFYDSAYRIEGRESFTKETLDELESEAELRDTFIEIQLQPGVYFTTGKQVTAWGESDFFRLNDRINSRDQRQLGVVEIQEARFPVFSSGLSYSPEEYSLVFQAVHEANDDKISPNGSEFDYFKYIRSDSVFVAEPLEPDVSFVDSSYFIKCTRFFNGGEISFYMADGHENLPYLDISGIDSSTGVISFTPHYKKTSSAGISGNYVRGNAVFKLETTFTSENAIQRGDIMEQLIRDPMALPVAWEEKDTVKSMIGVDYRGISDLTVILEGFGESIIDYNSNLLPDKHSGMIYIFALYETLNSTLDYSMQSVYRIKHKDTTVKLMASYDFFDALTIDAGVIFYMIPEIDSYYYPYRNNDMIFTGIKYSF